MEVLTPSSSQRVPTINDLRIKLCYICREEEAYGDPHVKRWVHPCSCTLIAHETCLLQWIKTAQESRGRSSNALKCPQCGAQYVLESHNPFILQVLNGANNALSRVGHVITLAGLGTVVVTFLGGLSNLLIYREIV
jgi:hypothetical protein